MSFNVVGMALKRPYTFVVMALLLLIMGPLAALRTPTDIFPEIEATEIPFFWAVIAITKNIETNIAPKNNAP